MGLNSHLLVCTRRTVTDCSAPPFLSFHDKGERFRHPVDHAGCRRWWFFDPGSLSRFGLSSSASPAEVAAPQAQTPDPWPLFTLVPEETCPACRCRAPALRPLAQTCPHSDLSVCCVSDTSAWVLHGHLESNTLGH